MLRIDVFSDAHKGRYWHVVLVKGPDLEASGEESWHTVLSTFDHADAMHTARQIARWASTPVNQVEIKEEG